MRVWYDTEFIEDGSTIELISIGMVAEDGHELYAVAEEIDDGKLYGRIRRHDWLMAHVVPHLPLRGELRPPGFGDLPTFNLDMDDNRIMPRRMIRNAVRDFLLSRLDQLELWAWYAAYDHVALAQLFGPMIHLPKGVPMYTHDLKQEVDRLGNPELPKQTSAEHNALADARWVRDAHLWLEHPRTNG